MEKWQFSDQNHALTPFEKCQVFYFLNFLFLYSLKKKKNGKLAIFRPKPLVNPFRKMSIFLLFQLLVFYSLKRRFFVLEYHKRHFPGLYFQKKKVGKMAIFGTKPWVKPFGKMSIFRLFDLLVFIAQKGVFTF